MAPLFSIIIPTLNEEVYLPRLLADLAGQTSRNFEVIIVDGRSQDLTLHKAKAYFQLLPHLTILSSHKRNVSHQRNRGSFRARGKYLLFIDADTGLPPDFLRRLAAKVSATLPNLFSTWCKPDSRSAADNFIAGAGNLTLQLRKIIHRPGSLGCLLGCKRSLFSKIGMFNPLIPFAEDSEFILRAAKKGYSFRFYPKPQYLQSFRRFRQAGYLKGIGKYLIMRSQTLIAKDPTKLDLDYPMGGHIHRNN